MIKLLYLFLFLNISTDNFRIEHNAVIWASTYETQRTISELAEYFEREGTLQNIKMGTDYLIADLRPSMLDATGAGYVRTRTPGYYIDSDLLAFVHIQRFEKHYTVKVSRMAFQKRRLSDPHAYPYITRLEEFAISPNGGFSRTFPGNQSSILDFTLRQLFQEKNLNQPKH